MTTFVSMIKVRTIQKLLVVAILAMGIQVAYAALAFTGMSDEKNKSSKFSLKSLSSLSHKSLSFSSLRSTLQYKGALTLPSTNTKDGAEMNSMLRYDNGNTTYIYPYKVKIKTPKFKTPSRN